MFDKKEENFELSMDDLKEVRKIQNILDPDEKVLVVAKQGRLNPGGAITTPNIIFATDTRLIIKNPTMLGLRVSYESIPYDTITSVKVEKGIMSSTLIIRSPGLSELTRLGKKTDLLAWGRGEEGSIDAIPKKKAEKLLLVIKRGMEKTKNQKNLGLADEIKKLAELREEGIITDEEFNESKRKLLGRL